MSTGSVAGTVPPPLSPPPPIMKHRRRRGVLGVVVVFGAVAALGAGLGVWLPHRGTFPVSALAGIRTDPTATATLTPTPTETPTPAFDPNVGAILPDHRIVAFYAVPGAAATGPAYLLSASMLARLRTQGAAYDALDPKHPVQLDRKS